MRLVSVLAVFLVVDWKARSFSTQKCRARCLDAMRKIDRRERVLFSDATGGLPSDSSGLYRPISDLIWAKVTKLFPNLCEIETPSNIVPAKGLADHQVRIQTRALRGDSLIRYARVALLETINNQEKMCTKGIQVMNWVVLPSIDSGLPVWSADFVSLPGDKHLLLLDSQPMALDESIKSQYETNFVEWKRQYVDGCFEAGDELPDAVQKFVSPNALWSRLMPTDDIGSVDILEKLQGPLLTATAQHFDIYSAMVLSDAHVDQPNQQDEYIKYRLANDPARPMLKSLYGEEWTENVLTDVLFPS